jgi:hypothetical protein
VKAVGIDNAVAISAGTGHTCALLRDRTVKCWGLNDGRQLGITSPSQTGTPITVGGVQGATAIACGGYFTCALSGGPVSCWGRNNNGWLGSGADPNVLGLSATPVAVAGVTTAISLAAGKFNGCVVLANGAVQCWGDNGDGQLGVTPSTLAFAASPKTISGITAPTALTIGEFHVCGLLPDGTVRCWGDDNEGQLGDGRLTTQSTTPLKVVGLTGVSAIAAGLLDACAIAGDGVTRCWGLGPLGNGGTDSALSYTPVAVMGLPDARKLSANEDTACAIRADGSIACWGSNNDGMLGDSGTHTYGQTPVPVTAAW